MRSSSPASGRDLGDRVEQADEPARGHHRGRVIGGLAALGQQHGLGADGFGQLRQQRQQRLVALERHGRAAQVRDGLVEVSERDERMEAALGRAGRHRRREHGRRQGAGRVDERLAAVEQQAAGRVRDGVVGHGQEDQVSVVEHGRGIGIGARAGHPFLEAPPALLVPARDRGHLPAGARERRAERRPDPARTDEADARLAVVDFVVVGVRMLVVGLTVLVVGAPVRVVGVVGQLFLRKRFALLRTSLRVVASATVRSSACGGIVGERTRRILGRSTYRDPRRAHPPGAAQPCQMLAGTRRPGTHEPSPVTTPDPFSARATLNVGGRDYTYYRLDKSGATDLARMPMTVKILLENTLRNAGVASSARTNAPPSLRWRPKAADRG